jgi:hypothetical protein
MIARLPLRLRDEGMVLHIAGEIDQPGALGAAGGHTDRSRTGGRALAHTSGAAGAPGWPRTGGWASHGSTGTMGPGGRQGGF